MAQLIAQESSGGGGNMDEMAKSAELQAESAAVGQKRKFVPASTGFNGVTVSAEASQGDLGEINIDDVMDNAQDTKRRAVASSSAIAFNVAEKVIPAAVFGGLANKSNGD